MKSLLVLSLLVSAASFASTSATTAKTATDTKALTLKEIAEKSQSTATLLEQNTSSNNLLNVDNSGRLNSKDEALKLSAENNKATSTKK